MSPAINNITAGPPSAIALIRGRYRALTKTYLLSPHCDNPKQRIRRCSVNRIREIPRKGIPDSPVRALLSPCAALSRPVLVTGPAFSEVIA